MVRIHAAGLYWQAARVPVRQHAETLRTGLIDCGIDRV